MSYIINFGKYSGREIHDIPRNYLNWCLEELEDEEFWWMSEKRRQELEEAIEEEFALRDRSHITF